MAEQNDDGAVPHLIQALGDERAVIRRGAVRTLALLGERPEAVAPALIRALKDADCSVRLSASEALARIGRPAVPFLLHVLKEDDADLRSAAIVTLGRIGPPAREAIPDLLPFLEDEVNSRQAAEALSQIRGGLHRLFAPRALEQLVFWVHLLLAFTFLGLELVVDVSAALFPSAQGPSLSTPPWHGE